MRNKKIIYPDFIQIPHQLILDENLTPADRIVYGVVYWYQKLKDGRCIASNETIGEVSNMEAGSVQNSLNRLEKYGYIERLYKDEKHAVRSEIKVLVSYKKTPSTSNSIPPLDNGTPPLDNGTLPPLDNGHNNKRNKEEKIKKNTKKSETDIFGKNSSPLFSTGNDFTEIPDGESSEADLNKKISEFIDLFKYVNPTHKELFSRKPERDALKFLILERGIEEIEQVVRRLPILLGDQYAPTVVRPSQFKRKYAEVVSYLMKAKKSEQKNAPKVASTF